VPLVVDLDGTLIASDTLFESTLALIRKEPLCILLLPVWLLRGKAILKAEIARRVNFRADALPYRRDLIDYLQEEHAAGRRLVLATAAHGSIAEQVATHLGLFDEVLSTDGQTNRKGAAKRDELLKRFGNRGFDYIGDHRADLPVWQASRVAHVAGGNSRLSTLAQTTGAHLGRAFVTSRPGWRIWMRALRVQQWVKNVLVFAPLLLAHHLNTHSLGTLVLVFFGFSSLASGTYIINDLFDVAADRDHPVKRNRPFASGDLSGARGMAMALLMMVAALAMGAALGLETLGCFCAYLLLTLSYSSWLKQKAVLDVVVLALLYTLRLIVGGVSAHVPISPWLFQFSIFLFLSLAFAKRFSELYRLNRQYELERKPDARTRGYRAADLSVVSQAGVASGLLAALVLAMYVNSPDVQRLYVRPSLLWAACPVFVYWITHLWMQAGRGQMNEDPIVFALRDRVSYLAGLLLLMLMIAAAVPYAH